MKIASLPQVQASRPLLSAATSENASIPAVAVDQVTSSASPENKKAEDQAISKEYNKLFKASRTGIAIGALALGGLAAGLGSLGGITGGIIGATAAFTLGTVGAIGGGLGLGYLGVTKGPDDIRALFLGLGGLIVGGTVGGLLGYYGGGALGALAGVQGGIAGATAGAISAAPIGALLGGGIQAGSILKKHGDEYPHIIKSLKEAKEEAAKEKAQEQAGPNI